ncbi:hypothetical protein HHL08_14250 [Sphingobium sp. AR-3-1]|uniref:Lipoprotein n=1 Tax=Sphingobium psychrophilum TaxID=2728834 RepID=A0A7X9WXE7_9SPHN|nr:hypothetical protein [Sphingobium psychrophilum]NML11293.1 hypothetical protein [Sphingobium psychrophilum]
MRWHILILALALASCSAGKEAEEKYHMVEKAKGGKRELCTAAGEVAAAYLADRNQVEYERWKLYRDTNCMAARYE